MNDAMQILAIRTINAAVTAIANPSPAVKHPMISSAECAIESARRCFNRDDFESATRRALDSLQYTYGICHETYIALAAEAAEAGVWGVAA